MALFVMSCSSVNTETTTETTEQIANKTTAIVDTIPSEPIASAEEIEDLTLPTVNIKEEEVITSPQKITVNSEGLWFATEGKLGHVELFDSEDNLLTEGHLMADGEWMTEKPALFSTALTFTVKEDTEKGKLVIYNNPGNGDGEEAGEKISFEVPVRFK